MPVTKYNYLITDINDLPEAMAEAFLHRPQRPARPGAGRHLQGRAERQDRLDTTQRQLTRPGLNKPVQDDPAAIDAAAELINQASRPLILAGHGVQMGRAQQELMELAEQAEIPVVTTLLGLGNIPETAPAGPGHGRHARRGGHQPRRAGMRRVDRRRHALRRPHHRPAGPVRPQGQGRPLRAGSRPRLARTCGRRWLCWATAKADPGRAAAAASSPTSTANG